MTNAIFTNTTITEAKYQRLKAPSGHEIKLQIKLRRFLLFSTNFNPLLFFDQFNEFTRTSQNIDKMDAIGKYDDGTGYVIFFLYKGTDIEHLQSEIELFFTNNFIEKNHENNQN